jgi:hypothetical protein
MLAYLAALQEYRYPQHNGRRPDSLLTLEILSLDGLITASCPFVVIVYDECVVYGGRTKYRGT